ncbi:MAG TPA: site-2 protease family protein [Gemmataceae bacterium]|nr:site-2 protease family protein [Gemmataceae bacterium]
MTHGTTMLGGRLRLHWSWPSFPVAVGLYGLAVVSWREALFFVALTLAIYLGVLVHAAGELLAARRFRLGARDITLYPFWSAIRYTRLSERPWQENYVAAAGIVLQALITTTIGGAVATAGLDLRFQRDIGPPYPEAFAVYLFWANVLLTAFYVTPILPLDGGRIFRASLALTTSRLRATEVAAGLSTVGALVLLVAGVFWFHNPLPAVVAVLLFLAAQDELGAARYFAGLRHQPQATPGAPVLIPMTEIVTPECEPDEPNFSGFTWNPKARLWIEWHDGRAVSASVLIGD